MEGPEHQSPYYTDALARYGTPTKLDADVMAATANGFVRHVDHDPVDLEVFHKCGKHFAERHLPNKCRGFDE